MRRLKLSFHEGTAILEVRRRFILYHDAMPRIAPMEKTEQEFPLEDRFQDADFDSNPLTYPHFLYHSK